MSSTNPALPAETADSATAAAPAATALPDALTGALPDAQPDAQPEGQSTASAPAAEPLAAQPDAAVQPTTAEAGAAAPEAVEGDASASGAQAGAQAAAPRAEVSTAATGARLAELFPALFAGAPKPLKLRIQVDIQERAPGEFSKQALSAFFRRLTGATSYLVAVSRGKQRFDLDGQPAGELSEEHRQLAADELTRRRANQQARRAQEDAQREQEEAGRRQRFSLLRDFETTKLTTANFCALKGVAPEQLDGLLAQARQEAQEDAARPRRPEHGHGRPGQGPGRRDGERREGERGPRREGGRNDGPRADAGGRRDDRGRPQGPRGPRGGGREGGGGQGAGGAGGAGGRNERRGPPRG